MKILITRPIAESQELAQQLIDMGHEVIITPLLEIHLVDNLDLKSFEQYEAIMISSKNAIKAIADANKQLKLLVVGQQTTKFAQSLGFANSIFAGEDISELQATIKTYKNLLYLSGEYVTKDLSSLEIKRQIVYKAIPIIPNTLINFIKLKSLKLCLFFSTRTAQVFVDFIMNHRLQSYCRNIIALTLSNKIAHSLKDLDFKNCYAADKPNSRDLVKLINRVKNK